MNIIKIENGFIVTQVINQQFGLSTTCGEYNYQKQYIFKTLDEVLEFIKSYYDKP